MAEFEKRDVNFISNRNIARQKRTFTAYKLIVDPALHNGGSKLYRFDGLIPDDPLYPPVTLLDPRGPDGKARLMAKAQSQSLTYALPILKIDNNFIGNPPALEVTITNINKNITKAYLEIELMEFGEMEELFFYCHPETKESLGLARVVFKSIAGAEMCVAELSKTPMMEQIEIFLDPFGRKCDEIYYNATVDAEKIEIETLKSDETSVSSDNQNESTPTYSKQESQDKSTRNTNSFPGADSPRDIRAENTSPRKTTRDNRYRSLQSDLYDSQSGKAPHSYLPNACIVYSYQTSSIHDAPIKQYQLGGAQDDASTSRYNTFDNAPKLDLDTRIKLLTKSKLFNDLARLLNIEDVLTENEHEGHSESKSPSKVADLSSLDNPNLALSNNVEEVYDECGISKKFKNTFVPVEVNDGKLDKIYISPLPSPFLSRFDDELELDPVSDGSLELSPQKSEDKEVPKAELDIPEDLSTIPLPSHSPPPLPSTEPIAPPPPPEYPPPDLYFPNYSHIPINNHPYGQFINYASLSSNHIPQGQYMYPSWISQFSSQSSEDSQPPLPLETFPELEKPPPPPEPLTILEEDSVVTSEDNTQSSPHIVISLDEMKKKIKERLIKKRLRMGRIFLKLISLKSRVRQKAKEQNETEKKTFDKKRDKSPPKLSLEPPIIVRDELGRARLVYKNMNLNMKSLPKIPKITPTPKIQIPVEVTKKFIQPARLRVKKEIVTDSDSYESAPESRVEKYKTRDHRRKTYAYSSSSEPSSSDSELDSCSEDESRTDSANELSDEYLSEGEILSSGPSEPENQRLKIEDDRPLITDSQSDVVTPIGEVEHQVKVTIKSENKSLDAKGVETTTDDSIGGENRDSLSPICHLVDDGYCVSDLPNVALPEKQKKSPAKPKKGQKVFPRRSKKAEHDTLYQFLTNGMDEEDIKYTQMAYVSMLNDESFSKPEYLWLRATHWSDHPATYNPHLKPDPSRRVHLTGSARTEGFYRPTAEEKTKDKRQWDSRCVSVHNDRAIALQPVNVNKNRSQGNVYREARSNQRRLIAELGNDVDSDLLKFNQLKFRKKKIRFGRSKIHDWGLFAAEPIASDEMVIEYVGERIRPIFADIRERKYEAVGIGSSYLFRVGDECVIDATKEGNVARFINHSCSPNCHAKIITIEGEKKIVIYSKQPIAVNEEITYNYKFPYEDCKIPCLCGASQCRGTLN